MTFWNSFALIVSLSACGSSPPRALPSASSEPRAEAWGNDACGTEAPGPKLAFATGPRGGGRGEELLGRVTLRPNDLPARIVIGDRAFDLRAFFRRCHEGRLQFLGVGITIGSRDLAIGFSPPLPAYEGIPRTANACELDLTTFRAASCPKDDRCRTYAALEAFHACSNQMSIPLGSRMQPPSEEERARGVTNVIFQDQIGVASYQADPVTGDFTEMTLERRVVRSETNPRLHD
jgi:hypothetical protein